MNNRRRLIALACPTILIAVACGSQPEFPSATSPTPTFAPSLAPSPAAAAATVETRNEIHQLNVTVLIPCVPEMVAVTGDLHFLDRLTIASTGNLHVMTHANPQNVSGTGEETGNMYHLVGGTAASAANITPGEVHILVHLFTFIGQGPGNNSTFRFLRRLTIDANGEVTTAAEDSYVECR